MCSRYYIDPGMTEDISRVVQNIDGRIWLAQGDTRPTDVAPVIGQSEHRLELGMCRWGYPLSKSKGLVINARVETVLDKPSFQNGILYHRLLIPAGGFYEWNSLKEKSIFTRLDSSVLYMAGFCDWFDNSKCLYFCRLSLNFCDFIFALVKVFKTSKSVFRPCFHINPVVQYVYKHKGGFDYHEEKKVFQITILNADYHDYCYVLPASPSSFR